MRLRRVFELFVMKMLQALAVNLAIINGINILMALVNRISVPYLIKRIGFWRLERRVVKAGGDPTVELFQPEVEYLLNQFDALSTVIEDYSSVAFQFGYIVLFVSPLPIAGTNTHSSTPPRP